MKRNQVIILIVLVAAIGGAGLMLYKRENQSWDGSDQRLGQKLIKGFPLNDVAQVLIKNPSGELNLVKKNEEWTVQERGGYPASFSQLQGFLRKVWELKVAQPQNVTAAQLSRFELVSTAQGSNSATLVEFRDAGGKTLHKLLLGKKHMRQSQGDSPFGGGGWPDGRYVMVGDDLKSVSLVNDAMADIEPKPEPWLDKDFVKVEKIKGVTIASAEATNNWAVTRDSEQGEWKFTQSGPAEELDKTKVASVGTALSSASFDDVIAPGAKTDQELGFDHPRLATIETFDHLTYKVSVGTTNSSGNYFLKLELAASLPKERVPAADEKAEDKDKLDKEFKEKNTKVEEKVKKEEKLQKWIYLVSKWSIDPLLKERKDLLVEKKETPPSTPAAPGNTPVIPFAPDPPVTPPVKATPATPPKIELKPVPPPPLPEKSTPAIPAVKPVPAAPANKPAPTPPAEKPPQIKPAETPATKPPEVPKPSEKTGDKPASGQQTPADK